ncbi:MAG TPA: PhnD/SsuA/transferrin family substrate-binding protein [Ramlibacter sp.]|nr:PhnD/SsuA/transferrin family substrate-binding protein [Ramlibacter sp.]
MNPQPTQAIAPSLGEPSAKLASRGPLLRWRRRVASAPASSLQLLIEEIGRDDADPGALVMRYEPLINHLLGRSATHGVQVRTVRDVEGFQGVLRGPQPPQLVFGKSVHRLAHLVRDHGWRPLVRRAGAYRAAFIVPADSPITHVAQLRGARILMPDEGAPAAAMARAELARRQVENMRITHVRYPEAVAALVQSGLADAGVVNIRTSRSWAARGGRVLCETLPMVHWSLLASPELDESVTGPLTEALLQLNLDAPALLAAIGVRRLIPCNRLEYVELLDYLRE